MTAKPDSGQGWLAVLARAVPLIILPIAVLSLPLSAAPTLGLTAGETAGWIMVLYALPALLSLALSRWYGLPLLYTGNLFVLLFIVSLAGELSFGELAGAAMVAAVAVLVITWLGLMRRLAAWIPAPIVLGLLSGAILPFVSDVFTFLGQAPLMIGAAVLAYLLGRRFLEPRVPAILAALVAGLVAAALAGQLGSAPATWSLPIPTLTAPVFTLHALLTAGPVLAVLLTLQSNVPSLVFLRHHGYRPPERAVNTVTGLATLAGSLLGPTGISLSLPVMALVAGPAAGPPRVQLRTLYLTSAVVLVMGLLGGLAADLASLIPLSLLLTLAGLAVIEVLSSALQRVVAGPLRLGPLVAFAVALSDVSLLGLGPYFWAIVLGMGTSLLLERDALREWRVAATSPAPG